MNKLFTIIFFVLSISLYGSWAEETLENMSKEEKIGQLFVISISPPRGAAHLEHLSEFLKKYPVGGVLFKQAYPLEQVHFLNAIQQISSVPLLTLADAEWGLGMRMNDTLSYPRNLTLGAVQNKQLLHAMGYQIGQQCRLVGTHINLAPVIDVNTNPDNPIIHMRAFGDDPLAVVSNAIPLIKGMQEASLFACVKHFPGHGDTVIDSHHDLPIILHSTNRLEKIELTPFSYAIASNIECVMSAHLLVPVYDQVPCTFSYPIITEMLQNKMGFNGLVVTDALNMQALTNYFSVEELGLRAFFSGHHLLLYGSHLDEVVDAILDDFVPKAFAAMLNENIPEELLNARVLKLLQAKERLGLHQNRFTPVQEELMKALHDPSYCVLIRRLYEEAVTMYREEQLPETKDKIAYIQVGKEEITPFFFDLKETFDVTPFLYGTTIPIEEFDQCIIALYQKEFPEDLRHLKATTAIFTTPYALKTCPETGTIIVGYEDVRVVEQVISKVIKGELKAKGKLPISLPLNKD